MSTPACQLNEFIVYRVLIVSFVYPSTGRNAVTFEQQTPQIVRTIRRPGATPHRKNTTDALAMLRGPGSPRTSAGRLAGDQPAVRAGWGGFDHRIKRRAEPTGCRQKAPLRAIDPRERAMPAGAAGAKAPWGGDVQGAVFPGNVGYVIAFRPKLRRGRSGETRAAASLLPNPLRMFSYARGGGVSRVAKGADCKSAGLRLRRFESYLPHHTNAGRRTDARSRTGRSRPRCGCSSMVEQQPSKLMTRVRFPSPAPLVSIARRSLLSQTPLRSVPQPGCVHRQLVRRLGVLLLGQVVRDALVAIDAGQAVLEGFRHHLRGLRLLVRVHRVR